MTIRSASSGSRVVLRSVPSRDERSGACGSAGCSAALAIANLLHVNIPICPARPTCPRARQATASAASMVGTRDPRTGSSQAQGFVRIAQLPRRRPSPGRGGQAARCRVRFRARSTTFLRATHGRPVAQLNAAAGCRIPGLSTGTRVTPAGPPRPSLTASVGVGERSGGARRPGSDR